MVSLRELIKEKQAYLINFFDGLLDAIDDPFELSIIGDLDNIDNDEIDDSERMELKRARVGQGKFRKNTIEFWGGIEKCAVTGLQLPPLLNASHIKPWNECTSKLEKLNGNNGIMLCAHLDRLFDRFLIGFQGSSKPNIRALVCSPKLKDKFPLLSQIGITTSLKLDLTYVKFAEQHILEAHLDKHLTRVLQE